MKTIAENIKYPEFREQYRGQLITGHLVRIDGMYYRHSKRVVTEMSYDELDEQSKASVAEYEESLKAMDARMAEVRREIRAKSAIIAWAIENAHEVGKSNKSESKYYHVRHTDGKGYTIRVSGHRYPTGSMTDLMFGNIDTTDSCCAKYCDMLGIEY